MPRLCRLTAPAQIDGAVRAPGYEFTLADEERGPHFVVRESPHGLVPEKLRDEPAFEVVSETPSES
jgi:hypothetical protein